MRIDSHQQFWQSASAPDSLSHIPILQQDYLPKHMEMSLKENGFHGCIAVQARQTQPDNQNLARWVIDHPYVLGAIGWWQSGLSIDPALVGVRSSLSHLADALPDCQLPIDVDCHLADLPDMTLLAENHPDQVFVLNHLGRPSIDAEHFDQWRQTISGLGNFPNVYCKLSHLVVASDDDNWDELPDKRIGLYVDAAVEVFGPERLMFGSNWPESSLIASYDEVVDTLTQTIEKLSTHEQKLIMGGTAAKCYNLDAN